MDKTNSQTLSEVLKQIFEILKIDHPTREKMTTEVIGFLTLTVMNNLLEQKGEAEQKKIQAEIESATAGKNESEKLQIIYEYFKNSWDPQSIEQANETVAHELVPKYVETLLEVATTEQQQHIRTLVNNYNAGTV